MSDDNDNDLARTNVLFDFLQGNAPKGYVIPPAEMPALTPDQAWTVIWYLGNLYWQVTDCVERCEVCGDLYHSEEGGDCLDYGDAPYHFCDTCMMGDEYADKANQQEATDDHA